MSPQHLLPLPKVPKTLRQPQTQQVTIFSTSYNFHKVLRLASCIQHLATNLESIKLQIKHTQ